MRVNLALHAKALLIRDVHYIVKDGKIDLVDASRGRVAELQRWPDGLQAAVEAKEGLMSPKAAASSTRSPCRRSCGVTRWCAA